MKKEMGKAREERKTWKRESCRESENEREREIEGK
jgi:hypothetical protein